MKRLLFALFLLLIALTVSVSPRASFAVEGNESYTVSWERIPAGDTGRAYQVFFGQADGDRYINAVGNGLNDRSRAVTLYHLKSCTTYSWSLKSQNKGSTWSWVLKDQRFTTGGNCNPNPQPLVSAGASMVKNVMPKAGGLSSSTVTWTPKPEATGYHVYYRSAASSAYESSVVVPSTGSSVTIGGLKPGVKYYYQVRVVINGQEVSYAEKVLQQPSGEKPVLGTKTAKVTVPQAKKVLGQTTNAMMNKTVKPKAVCADTGAASVSIRVPNGVNATKVHVLYGTEPGRYEHALRDVSNSAREVTISHLSCRPYYYQVTVVGIDGRVHWQGEKMMSPSSN